MNKSIVDVPTPSESEVEKYLKKWNSLENYRLQELSLDKLFFELCPYNVDINDILIKCSTLNDFYSTKILSIFSVSKHIKELNIDNRLSHWDSSLVDDMKVVSISGKKKNFYSFSTKYCSHHNPIDYPIYDSYVDEVLRFFRKRDGFCQFINKDLKDYPKFRDILLSFKKFYQLDKYNLKEIDKYLWLLGKEYFPKKY